MRIRETESEAEEGINLVPLIDTLFFLVLFFLIATRFKEEERAIGIQLPPLSTNQPLSAVPRQLIVNIREDGSAEVAGKGYSFAELEPFIAQAIAADPKREVLIRADERSLHRYFAAVAALCRRAGVVEARIGYLLEER